MTDSAADAREYAFRLLRYRSRSEKELRERLEKKGFSEKNIAATLKQLKETGYLDDHALARQLERQASNNRLLGHKRTKSFLLDRGVPSEIVEATLRYDEVEETEKIQKLIDKKLKTMGNYLDKKNEKRLWDYLMRRGYPFSIIRKACQNLKLIVEEEEN